MSPHDAGPSSPNQPSGRLDGQSPTAPLGPPVGSPAGGPLIRPAAGSGPGADGAMAGSEGQYTRSPGTPSAIPQKTLIATRAPAPAMGRTRCAARAPKITARSASGVTRAIEPSESSAPPWTSASVSSSSP